MYYIFNMEGQCICSSSSTPNFDDLNTRGELVIECEAVFDITQICLINGQIQAKATSPDSETETVDSSISNEILDMAEIILDMSDTIKALQKGGETS